VHAGEDAEAEAAALDVGVTARGDPQLEAGAGARRHRADELGDVDDPLDPHRVGQEPLQKVVDGRLEQVADEVHLDQVGDQAAGEVEDVADDPAAAHRRIELEVRDVGQRDDQLAVPRVDADSDDGVDHRVVGGDVEDRKST